MTTARTAVRTFQGRKAPGLAADIADLFRTLAKALLDPYRPELHYMRGPGPKWQAKHNPAPLGLHGIAMPALVPVRVRR
jgi:hypothetical protein